MSFTEARQRLLDPPPAGTSFLGAGDHELRSLFEEARTRLRHMASGANPSTEDIRAFNGWMLERIEPFNVAGLGDPTRANLYPVDLDILVDRAHLLGLSRGQMEAALPRLRGEKDTL